MKLYVWEDVLNFGTGGIAFAFANNVEEAHRLVLQKYDWAACFFPEDVEKNKERFTCPKFDGENPVEHTDPFADCVLGGD